MIDDGIPHSESDRLTAPAKEGRPTADAGSPAPVFAVFFLAAVAITTLLPVVPNVVIAISDAPTAARWAAYFTAVTAVSATVLTPLLGALSDRMGRKPVVLAALLLLLWTAAGNALGYFFSSLAFFALARLGPLGLLWPPVAAALTDRSTAFLSRTQAVAKLAGTLGVAVIVGPISGGVLAQYSLPPVFALSCGLMLVSIATAAATLPRQPPAAAPDAAPRNPLSGLRLVARNPTLLAFATALALFKCLDMNIGAVLVIYLRVRFGWGTLQAGLFTAFAGFCMAVWQVVGSMLLLPRVAEHRRYRFLLVAIGAELATEVLFGLSNRWWQFGAVSAVLLFGKTASPILVSQLSYHAGPNAGLALGGVNSIQSVLEVASGFAVTHAFAFAVERYDAADPRIGIPFYINGLLVVTVLLIVVALRERFVFEPVSAPDTCVVSEEMRTKAEELL